MSKYFIPYNKAEDPTYPEEVKYIREVVESKYGKFNCTNAKIGDLWRDFSNEYDACFLHPSDEWIERFAEWLGYEDDEEDDFE